MACAALWHTIQSCTGGVPHIDARAPRASGQPALMLLTLLLCRAESVSKAAASFVSCRVAATDGGHLTPFEAGFSLSSGSDPTKDVILRLEAESNEETKVSRTPPASCADARRCNLNP